MTYKIYNHYNRPTEKIFRKDKTDECRKGQTFNPSEIIKRSQQGEALRLGINRVGNYDTTDNLLTTDKIQLAEHKKNLEFQKSKLLKIEQQNWENQKREETEKLKKQAIEEYKNNNPDKGGIITA